MQAPVDSIEAARGILRDNYTIGWPTVLPLALLFWLAMRKVPWNTCGAFMAATLGVPTLACLPYAFLNLLNPLIAIFYGITHLTITPLEEDEESATEPASA